MKLDKLTTLLVVDAIEPALPAFGKLGYEVTVRVPEKGTLGFVILAGGPGALMLQTRASLAEDLPAVAALEPRSLLYADVSIPLKNMRRAHRLYALSHTRCAVRVRACEHTHTSAAVVGRAVPSRRCAHFACSARPRMWPHSSCTQISRAP